MTRSFVIGLAALLLSACTSVFLVPDRYVRISPDKLNLDYQDVWLQASDGVRLHGWHLKADNPRHGTILFFHGNAQNNSAHIASVFWLPAYGFDVFMLDPRGYGRSGGEAAVDGVHLDAEAALKHLAEQRCGEIIVFGQSFGGALAIYSVANSPHRHCVRAVITEGAFSGYRRIASEKLRQFWLTWPFQGPLSLLISDEYSPDRIVGKLSPAPILIIHGEVDGTVPPHHAELLFNAAKEPRELWLFSDAGHINAFVDIKRRRQLVEWISQALGHARAPNVGQANRE